MEYKNTIVAVDGSEAAERAFTKSLDIVKRNNAKLILAHVLLLQKHMTGRLQNVRSNMQGNC